MAFHCGALTRDGSACERHVREPGIRCSQRRNLGGTALHPPRYAMRTIALTDPALTDPRTVWSPNAWTTARSGLTHRAAELRDRVMWSPEQESDAAEPGTVGDEEAVTTEDETTVGVEAKDFVGGGGATAREGGAAVPDDGPADGGGAAP